MQECKIEKELYPDGYRKIEMELISMLSERRCWDDKLKICDTLYNIRKDAKNMKEEREYLNRPKDIPDCGCRHNDDLLVIPKE